MTELKGNYEGYIWKSNENQPQVFNGAEEVVITLDEQANPFVMEGQLFDGKESVSIRYADGKFFVNRVKIDAENGEWSECSYFGNRGELTNKKLKFRQYWKAEIDEKCENMQVLQPAALVFVGFENMEKKQ